YRNLLSKRGHLTVSSDALQNFEDPWILGLQLSIHGYIFGRVLAKEYQRVAYLVSLVDGSRNLFHHPCLRLGTNARRRFNENYCHGLSPFAPIRNEGTPFAQVAPLPVRSSALRRFPLQRGADVTPHGGSILGGKTPVLRAENLLFRSGQCT